MARRSGKSADKPIKFEEGSGNVFADLCLKDADQLLVRSQIGYHVFKILEAGS
jgi:hypothetical protein